MDGGAALDEDLPRPSHHRGTVAHLCNHDDRRGAEIFAYGLSRRLAEVGFTSTVQALLASGSSDPLPLRTLGGHRRTPRHAIRARRLARTADVLVGYGAGTLMFGAAATAGTSTRFIYRTIGDPGFWGQVALANLRIGLPLRQAERIVVLWPGAATTLEARYGIDPERITVIPNGRDPRYFRPPTPEERAAARAAYGIHDDRPVVGYLGALSWEKDPLAAVRAVARIPDATLILAGHGPMRAEVEHEVAQIGARATLLGSVAETLDLYHAIDTLVLPSRTEGMPGVVIEAALCGVPTVATDVGGTRMLVDDTTGWLVPTADPDLLEQALRTVLDDAPTRGAAALANARAGFTIDLVTDRWGALLDDVVGAIPVSRRKVAPAGPTPGVDAPIRSLHLLATNGRRGAEVFGQELAEHLARRGIATVCALSPTTDPARLDVPTYRRRSDPRSLLKLRRDAADHDVVVAHGAATLMSVAAALLGSPTRFVYRSIGDPSYWGRARTTRARISPPLHRANRVVALWPGSAQTWHDLYGIPWDRIDVIPNAASPDRFGPVDAAARAAAREDLGLPDGPVIAYLGALTPEKRPDLAMAAAALWPEATLVMVGTGSEAPGLIARAAVEAPRTRFVGAMPDPRPLLAAADVLVLSSATEGLPGVAIEAGLSKLPVVATDVGGTGEVVVDGVTGRLVPFGDAGAMATALRWAVDHAEECGAAARDRCVERFAMSRVAAQWEDLLQRVVQAPR